MSYKSPSNNVNEPEGSKDGRQWTSSEIFAFIGFLNNEKNDGALRNTTTKFVAPILKKGERISRHLDSGRIDKWRFRY
ncbi:hypothetical protein E4U58_006245 [Claviceps cyperi]|nr:hypothetical protein E4U58_006245 [Claviceps cyperi]